MVSLVRFPALSCPVVVRGGSAEFRLSDRTLTVEAPAGVLSALVARCDGEVALKEVKHELGKRWRPADVSRFLAALIAQGVLVDADRAALAAWPLVENPGPNRKAIEARDLGALLGRAAREVASRAQRGFRQPAPFGMRKLLEKRRSTRSFSEGTVPLSKIRALLWAAYGVQPLRRPDASGLPPHRTVPSGGELFPLQVHLVNLRAVPGLARGVYRVRYRADGAIGLARIRRPADDLYRAFVDPGVLLSAQSVIVISGRFGRSARKYGNRSLLLVSLEAGHAAQNAMLAAADLGIAAVEVGGFVEALIRDLTGAGPDSSPLTTIVFGSRPRKAMVNQPAGAPDFEFTWIDLDREDFRATFQCGSAVFTEGKGKDVFCWGRDPSPAAAYTKTIAELWERHGCRSPRGIYIAYREELAGALDPRSVAAYLPVQYARRGFPVAPYSDRRRYGWKDGIDYANGRNVPVPAELVYFRNTLERKLRISACASVSTSGVAAFSDAEGAIRRSVLELIERDAFMRTWLSGVAAPTIQLESLPGRIRQRVANLKRLGLRVVIKDISGSLAPVILIFAQHEARFFTVVACGANFDPEAALDHAMMELESQAFVRLLGEPARSIAPQDARLPEDHGRLYAQRRYFRRADRLARTGAMRRFSSVGRGAALRWGSLLERLRTQGRRLVCVDITPFGARMGASGAPLHVVRAIVPGLLPISFGFGTEPLALSEGKSLLGEAKFDSLSRGKTTLFPHPFA